MAWRDGVHLTGTPIWCDARRRRDVCFVSSAGVDRMTKSGHGQLIATQLTLGLLGADGPDGGHLGAPLHRRFTLGTLRLELVPSGRGVGAASLFVDIAGRGVLYASAIRKDVPVLAGAYAIQPADVRTADAAVVAVPYTDERERFPPLADTLDQLDAWCRTELAAGRRPALVVDTILDALELAACLAQRGLALAAVRRIRDAIDRFEKAAWVEASASVLAVTKAPGKEPRVTLGLADDRPGLVRALGAHAHTVASVSGSARDAAFAWPCSAGKLDLLAWIESTGARFVYLTGPGSPKLAATLGPRAHVLGPPKQMTLW